LEKKLTQSFKTNLKKGGSRGAYLERNEDLTITVEGNPYATSGMLYQRKFKIFWRPIQAEQTGTKFNPEKNQITFEMRKWNRKEGRHEALLGEFSFKLRGYFTGTVKGWNGTKFSVK
jgi:hypothetical protein